MDKKRKEELAAQRAARRNKKAVYIIATCAFTGFTSKCLRHFDKVMVENPKFDENSDDSEPLIQVFKVKGHIPQKYLDNPLYLSKDSNTNWFSPK